jgi:hypothetical protein
MYRIELTKEIKVETYKRDLERENNLKKRDGDTVQRQV